MKKKNLSVFIPVDSALLDAYRAFLDARGNKRAFLDSLPKTRAIGKHKPIYTRRQLDYGLERGIMQQGLLNHLSTWYQMNAPAHAAPA